MQFPQILRKLRKEKNLTQEELAKILKTAPSAISMYERGEREPSLETIMSIANFFSVDIDFLLGKSPPYEDSTSSPEESSGIGEKIRPLREKLGLSQSKLAKEIGVPLQTFRKWELGFVANLSRDNLFSLCRLLHTTPSFLMGFEESDINPISDKPVELSPHEKALVSAYRANPAMQSAVDKLLGIDTVNSDIAQDMIETVRAGSSLKKPTNTR